jgi:hypothetical protein
MASDATSIESSFANARALLPKQQAELEKAKADLLAAENAVQATWLDCQHLEAYLDGIGALPYDKPLKYDGSAPV